jgi:hypothetical protein
MVRAIEKESRFLFGNTLLWHEKRRRSDCMLVCSIAASMPAQFSGKQRADFDRTAIAKMLWDRVTAGFKHDGWLPRFSGNVSKSQNDFLSACA